MTGRKDDTGKPRAGLMLGSFADALTELARVNDFGAEKYGPENWRQVPDAVNRYRDALARHALKALADPKAGDLETGLSELAHVAWNALALIEMIMDAESGDGR